MLDGLQAFNQRLGFHRRQLGQAFARTGHHRGQRQILGHIDQVRLGRRSISFTPLDRPLKRLVQQLPRHDRQHDLPQHRHEHRHHVQSEHADFQQVVELLRPYSRIDVRRGHRMAACVGDDFLAVLLVEISPQITVGGPDARHALANHPEWIEVRIFDRLTFTRRFWRQLFDAGDGRQRGHVLEDLQPE
ncbi:hypothetical protein D3C79_797320 [compost metagenome]